MKLGPSNIKVGLGVMRFLPKIESLVSVFMLMWKDRLYLMIMPRLYDIQQL